MARTYTDKEARQLLNDEHFRYLRAKSTMPDEEILGIVKRKPIKLKTTNGMTQAIVRFLMLRGHYANRVSSAGVQIAGNGGKKIHRPSTTRPGTGDIFAYLWNGVGCTIEIKNEYTKDDKRRLSEDQERERKYVERTGAMWFTCTSFTHFINWYMAWDEIHRPQLKRA